jgi:hypothetical protein
VTWCCAKLARAGRRDVLRELSFDEMEIKGIIG